MFENIFWNREINRTIGDGVYWLSNANKLHPRGLSGITIML